MARWVLILLGCAGCHSAYRCTTDGSCRDRSRQGVCVPAEDGASYCAFIDESCVSRLRWDESAARAFGGTCVAMDPDPRPEYTVDDCAATSIDAACSGSAFDSRCGKPSESCPTCCHVCNQAAFQATNQCGGCDGRTCFVRYPGFGHGGTLAMRTRDVPPGGITAYARWNFPAPLAGHYRILAEIPDLTGAGVPPGCGSFALATEVVYFVKGDGMVTDRPVDQRAAAGGRALLFEGDATGVTHVTVGNRWVTGESGCGLVALDGVIAEPFRSSK